MKYKTDYRIKTSINRADYVTLVQEFGDSLAERMQTFLWPDGRMLERAPTAPEQDTDGDKVNNDDGLVEQAFTPPDLKSRLMITRVSEREVIVDDEDLLRDDPDLEAASAQSDYYGQELLRIYDQFKPQPDQKRPSAEPLIPWSHLVSFLRESLSQMMPGRMLDMHQVNRSLETGRPIVKLPCVPIRVWSQQSELLLDRSKRLGVFFDDYDYLSHQLSTRLGDHRLCVHNLLALDKRQGYGFFSREADKQYQPPLPRQPILILSDLGFYESKPGSQAHWEYLGKAFEAAGIKPTVLLPCPPRLWRSGLSRYYTMVYWDRGASLCGSRHGSAHSLEPRDNQGTNQLLALFSIFWLIEPQALREARLRLPLESPNPHLENPKTKKALSV